MSELIGLILLSGCRILVINAGLVFGRKRIIREINPSKTELIWLTIVLGGTLVSFRMNETVLGMTLCPGNDAELIRCVLGTTLNSSVVVQGMTVKLRPCLRFRACG